ncbi:hypothetical protein SSS_07408, partial [Sarcoptes scabiei]
KNLSSLIFFSSRSRSKLFVDIFNHTQFFISTICCVLESISIGKNFSVIQPHSHRQLLIVWIIADLDFFKFSDFHLSLSWKKMREFKNYAKDIQQDGNCTIEDWFERIIECINIHFDGRMPLGGFELLNKVFCSRFNQNITHKQFQRKYCYRKFEKTSEGKKRKSLNAILNEDSSQQQQEEQQGCLGKLIIGRGSIKESKLFISTSRRSVNLFVVSNKTRHHV